ncbi:MAG: 3'(2'),5'-bisphosphate nucleotidase [Anaerolineaceae bacterium 4572_78]|nr:MAG: 3'(2'),5'-bisphosphate nucleotidase [Anaerolineaceae bacterium 4572_78]
MRYTSEKMTAIQAVRNAAKLCKQVQSDFVRPSTLTKKDKSPVTIADFCSQAIVCQHLKETFPDACIVGEENADSLRKPENAKLLQQISSYICQFHPEATPEQVCDWIDMGADTVVKHYWTLDPIDGTKGFLRREQYAIALALVESGQVKIGVLACPNLPVDIDNPNGEKGLLFVAVRGHGVEILYLNEDKAKLIPIKPSTNQITLRLVESVETAHGDHTRQEKIARKVGIKLPSLRIDSQAKYAVVARGDATLYLRLPSPKTPDYHEKIWDHAAGTIITEEMGGQVSDMQGLPLDFASDHEMRYNRGVVVSNGGIHLAVIESLKDV